MCQTHSAGGWPTTTSETGPRSTSRARDRPVPAHARNPIIPEAGGFLSRPRGTTVAVASKRKTGGDMGIVLILVLALNFGISSFDAWSVGRSSTSEATMKRSRLLIAQAPGAPAPGSVPRIGVLWPYQRVPADPTLEAFRQGLRDVGYFDGQNLRVEYRYAEGKLARLADFATEWVALKVDVIVTAGTPAVRAAKDATRTIPIVMASNADPVGEGLVRSLAKPGGNITGSTHMSPQLSAKRLDLLKEAFPRIAAVAILYHPADGGVRSEIEAAQIAARALRVTLQMVTVHAPGEFEGAFALIARGGADALLVLSHTFTLAHRERVVELAARSKKPVMYGLREFVDAGGLMSYHSDRLALYRRAGIFVDRILKGAKPADLPVEQAINFDLVINLKTARELGLSFPPSIVGRATEVLR
jgi:putative ABC transport system substrate-binding protein